MRNKLKKFIIEQFPLCESRDGWAVPNPLCLLILKILRL
jgi:hypothetical protein